MAWYLGAYDKSGASTVEGQDSSPSAFKKDNPGVVIVSRGFPTQKALDEWISKNPHWPVKKSPPAPKQPKGGGGKATSPGKLGTFGQWKNWIDSRAPGQGDKWITWVESHAKIVPPESGTVDLSSNMFPTGGSFLKGNTSNNYAANWFAAWILEGNVGPDIAKLLAGGITAVGKQIPKSILPGFAAGIADTPGISQVAALGEIGNFFATLGEPQTILRIGKVLLGIVLVTVGVIHLTSNKSVMQTVTKTAKKVAETAAIA